MLLSFTAATEVSVLSLLSQYFLQRRAISHIACQLRIIIEISFINIIRLLYTLLLLLSFPRVSHDFVDSFRRCSLTNYQLLRF